MSLLVDEVRRSLRNDKITKRAEGKKQCEKLIEDDSFAICATSKDWTELLRACMEYEVKEIEAARKKRANTLHNDTALFIKKVIKHCVSGGVMNPKRCSEVLRHSLRTVYDHEDPVRNSHAFKEEHKNIMCEIFNIQVVHFMKADCFRDTLVFLKDVMVDRKSCSDVIHLRLLKAFARSLYTDVSRSERLCVHLLEWINDTVLPSVADDLTSQANVSAAVASVYTSLLLYDGYNNADAILHFVKVPIRIFIRHLTSSQQRDPKRDPYLRFFQTYMKYGRKWHMTVGKPLSKMDPLVHSLGSLYSALLDRDTLCALIVGVHNNHSPKLGKDVYCYALSVPKVRLEFEVLAKACGLYFQYAESDPEPSISQQQADSSQRKRKHFMMSAADDRSVVTAGQGGRGASMQQAPRSFREIMEGLDSCFATVTSSGSKSFGDAATGGAKRVTGSARPSQSRDRIALEAWLLLIISLFEQHEDVDFLQDGVESGFAKARGRGSGLTLNRIHVAENLTALLENLMQKFEELREKRGYEQIVGSMFKVLVSMVPCAAKSLQECDDDPMQLLTRAKNQLRERWTEMCSYLVIESSYRTYFCSCHPHTISQAAYEMLYTVLEHRVLSAHVQCIMCFNLWKLLPINDARMVSGSIFFSLVDLLVQESCGEVPAGLGKKCLESFTDNVMHSDALDDAGANEADDELVTFHQSLEGVMHTATASRDWGSLVYFASYLRLASCGKQPLLSVNHFVDLAKAVRRMIGTVLISKMSHENHTQQHSMPTHSSSRCTLEKEYFCWLQDEGVAQVVIQSEHEIQVLGPRRCEDKKSRSHSRPQAVADQIDCSVPIQILDVVTSSMRASLRAEQTVGEDNVDLPAALAAVLPIFSAIGALMCTCDDAYQNEQLLNMLSQLSEGVVDVLLARMHVIRWDHISTFLDAVASEFSLTSVFRGIEIREKTHENFYRQVVLCWVKVAERIRDLALHKNTDDAAAFLSASDSSRPPSRTSVTSSNGGHVNGNHRGRKRPAESDDDDDFMEKVTKVAFDSDDDDDDTSRHHFRRDQMGDDHFSATGKRLYLSAHQLAAYGAVARIVASLDIGIEDTSPECLYHLLRSSHGGVATSPRSQKAQTTSIWCPAEYFLAIAEQIAAARPNAAALTFVMQSSWHVALGPVGFSRVLHIFCLCTDSMDAFDSAFPKHSEARESFLHTFETLTFASDESVETLPGIFWRVRQMQLKCMYNLCQFGVSAELKKKVQFLCLDCIADRDQRVRMAVAEYLPMLLDLFSNHDRIYAALLESLGFTCIVNKDSFRSNEIDGAAPNSPLANGLIAGKLTDSVTALYACAAMASSPQIMHTACFDILRSSVSRRIFQQTNPSVASCVDFDGVMMHLLEHVAKSLRHRSLSVFMASELPCFLSLWAHPMSDLNKLELRYFPYFLLSEDEMANKKLLVIDPEKNANQVLHSYGYLIISTICQINDQRLRWNELLDHAERFGHGTTDQGVARALRSAFSCVYANSIILKQTNMRAGEGNDNGNLRENPGEELDKFMRRCLSEVEFEEAFESELADIVKHILLSPMHSAEYEDKTRQTFEDLAANLERCMASLAAQLPACSMNNLLERANLVEILSSLYVQIHDCASEITQLRALSVVHLITADEKSLITWPVLQACSLLLSQVIRFNASTSLIVSTAMRNLARNYVSTTQRRSPKGKRAATSAWEFTGGDRMAVTELAAQAVSMMCALISMQQQKSPSPSLTALYEDFSSIHMDGKSADSCAALLTETISILWKFLGPIEGVVKFFPLVPQKVMNELPQRLQDAMEGSITLSFTEARWSVWCSVDDALSGLPVSTAVLLLQVEGLNDLLGGQMDSATDMVDTADEYQSWDTHEREIAPLCASLIAMCDESRRKNDKLNDRSQIALNESIVQILGRLGPPDPEAVDQNLISVNKSQKSSMDVKIGVIERLFGLSFASSSRIADTAISTLKSLAIEDNTDVDQVITKGELEALMRMFRDQPGSREKARVKPQPTRHSAFDGALWSTRDKGYTSWICGVTAALLGDCAAHVDPFLAALRDISELDADTSEEVFPLIIHDLLHRKVDVRTSTSSTSKRASCGEMNYREILSRLFNEFLFTESCTMLPAIRLACKTVMYLLRQQINIFAEVTTRKRVKGDTAREQLESRRNTMKTIGTTPYFTGLDVDMLAVATAALKCDCQSTALLLFELDSSDKERQADLLIDICEGLHDPDLLFGIKQEHADLRLQAKQFARTARWKEALTTYESLLVEPTSMQDAPFGVARALQGLGCRHVLNSWTNNTLGKTATTNTEIRGLSSECLWRQLETQMVTAGEQAADDLGSWGGSPAMETVTHTQISVFSSKEMTNHMLANFVKSVRYGHRNRLQDISRQCMNLMLPNLVAEGKSESALSLAKSIATAQQIIEITEFAQVFDSPATDTQRAMQHMISTWEKRIQGSTTGGLNQPSEAIIAMRTTLLRELCASGKCRSKDVCSFLSSIDNITLDEHVAHSLSPAFYRLQDAIMTSAKNKSSITDVRMTEAALKLQECRLLWKKGLHDAAQATLDAQIRLWRAQTTGRARDAQANDLMSELLRTRGEWAILNRSAAEMTITQEYLLPASECAQSVDVRIKASLTMADYYAKMYQSNKTRLQSFEWQQSQRVAADRTAEFRRCKDLLNKEKAKHAKGENLPDEVRALLRHMQTLKKEVEIDEKERATVVQSGNMFLLHALVEFLKVMEMSPTSDLKTAFQVIHLWMNNCDHLDANSLLDSALPRIPSYKFVPLTYQIFSRLDSIAGDGATKKTSPAERFQRILQALVYRMCCDHPHHTLQQLYSLANAMQVNSSNFRSNVHKGRCESAKELVGRLKATSDDTLRSLTLSTDHLLSAYIALASASVEKFQHSNRTKGIGFRELCDRHQMPFSDCMKDQKVVPCVATYTPQLRADCDYSYSLVKIVGFKPTFAITDFGLSRPKIIECEGSDGMMYKQLVKGGDDMRQDAVMEQVFGFVNHMLLRERRTRQRLLTIRTYKIVPTTPQTGMIEWVNDTVPFGMYLTDRDGAHSRYHQKDWSHSKCREHLKDASIEDLGDREKRLLDIYRNFQPAFRYFFLEKFGGPSEWVARRTAYTRSTAAASIVGYVLGIGDRHSHNILIDTVTAEAVHIDFGIVFEQGKTLGTPETVPFRLTRDIVDGMGICGCEGTFRKCCEETMRVLRENALPMLTILNVVLHDPLYKWSLSPAQARRRQRGEDDTAAQNNNITNMLHGQQGTTQPQTGNGNGGQFGRDAGARALARIRSKLQGYEDPTGDGMGISGHVDLLITQAKSTESLSKLFPGWAPWL